MQAMGGKKRGLTGDEITNEPRKVVLADPVDEREKFVEVGADIT
jgi:hypothetical protein